MMVQILILGPGCEACDLLASNAKDALLECDFSGEVQRVTDVLDITALKVAVTPALVIDGTLKSSGRVPSVDEIKGWLNSSGRHK